jgi:hypothetical protein
MRGLLLAIPVWLGTATLAWAQAGGPELKTDDPYFPGEGALSTPSRVLQHANATPRGSLGASTDREKLIRLFLWRAEHYAHLYSPAVYNLPGVTPSPKSDNTLMTDYDAMRTLFSYGWGLCGTNHAQMRVFADEAGWPSRRRALVGDTGYEIFVDGGWRYTNTDQYTLHFLSDSPAAHFASLDQVVGTNHHYIEWNPDLGMGYRLPQANTHGNYQDFVGVTRTVPHRSLQWRDYYQNVWAVPAGGNYKLYGEGYTTTPVLVHLKRGETFTRWLQPSGAVNDLGLAGRVWWGYDAGNLGGGDNSPFAKWSFVQNAPARDQVAGQPEASSLVGQRYGNGCFQWTPNLAQAEHLDGTAATTGAFSTGGSPALKATAASTLVLFHHAPYTIAARPADATDPATPSSDGAVLAADTVGSIPVEVSTNAGATWASIGALSGTGARIDFTDSVKGRNQYLLRLSFDAGEGLNAFTLRTITMLSQAVYPNLRSGTTQVTYRAANAAALELSPDLWSAASANSGTGYVQKVADSGNVTGVYYATEPVGYASTNGNPISLTYKITMPPQLAAAGATWKQIYAAANAIVRVSPSGGPYTRIEISPDQGTWTQIGRYDPPADDEFSAYWAYGRSSDAAALGGTAYYVRYTTYNGTYTSKFRYLRLSAAYTVPAPAAPLQVTYSWSNGANQTSTRTIAAGATADAWSIATGTNVVQQKVVLAVPSGAAAPTAPSITTEPADQTVTAGQTATFSVVAAGTAPLSYRWQKNGVDIPGATASSYTTPATTLADNGSTYRVIVSNAAGSATSRSAVLTVNGGGGGGSTTVTLQQGVNGYAGAVDTYIDQFAPTSSFGTVDRLEVRYYDPGTGLSEHMRTLLKFDLSAIPAGSTVTAAQLTLYNTRAAANGANDVVALDKVLSAWTDTHTYAMGIPSAAPSGVTCPSVASYTLSPATPETFVVTGLETLVQGWVSSPASNFGIMLSTATNLNIRFASSEYALAAYRPALQITYASGGGGTAPSITTPPADQMVTVGQTATFTVTATGTAPLTYQWQRNGVDIPGATSSSYTTPPLTAADDGATYRVIVSNASGTVTSAAATLTVLSGGGVPAASGSSDDDSKCGCGTVRPRSAFLLLLALALLAPGMTISRRYLVIGGMTR